MKNKTVDRSILNKKDGKPARMLNQDPNPNLINQNTKLYKRAATHSLD